MKTRQVEDCIKIKIYNKQTITLFIYLCFDKGDQKFNNNIDNLILLRNFKKCIKRTLWVINRVLKNLLVTDFNNNMIQVSEQVDSQSRSALC